MKLQFRKYFDLRYKQLTRQSKLITLLLIMILIAASLLIVNQEVINQRIYTMIGTSLKEWVHKETDGLYHLDYDNFHVNTLKEQVTLEKVSLRLDSTLLNSLAEKPESLYRISSPKIFLDITSIWNVVFNNKLDLKNIKVDKPELYIYKLSNADTSANLSLESGDLYFKLDKYLDEFNIEKFFLEGGKIVYKKQIKGEEREVSIDDLDVYVDNLNVDASNRTAGTDRIRVVLKKPTFMLGDGIHKIQMDSLIVDSKYETIRLNEVYIFPDYEKLKKSNLEEINVYNFKIPDIHLEGINFAQAYQDNILEIDKITIPNPEIIIDTHKKKEVKTKDEKSSNSLPILLSQLFSRILTHELRIDDAKMDLAIEASDKMRNIKIKNTSLFISGLDLDTLKYSRENNHIKYDKINFRLDDYELILPDSIHELKAKTIVYHTDSSDLKIFDVYVYPNEKVIHNDTINKFEVTIPLIAFRDFELKDYLKNHQIDLRDIEIKNPEVVFHNQKKGDPLKVQDLNFHLPNNKIANYIRADQIHFDDVHFIIKTNNQAKISFKYGDLEFTDFKLSPSIPTKNKIFNSRNVDVSIAELSIFHPEFKTIQATSVKGNINNPSFQIAQLKLESKDQQWGVEGNKIEIEDFNLELYLNTSDIAIDLVRMGDAKVYYNVDSIVRNKEKKPLNLTLNKFEISKGEFIVQDKGVMTSRINNIKGKVNDISINEKEKLIGKVDLSTGEITHVMGDKNIEIGALRSTITNKNLLLHLPYTKPIDYSLDNALTIKASQLALLNYDLYLLLNKKKFISEELKILSTTFQIKNQKAPESNNQKDLLYLNWENILKDDFEEIKIQRVILSGPKLNLNVNEGLITSESYLIELNSFNTTLDGRNHLLNSNNIRIEVEQASYENENIKLKADQFNLDEDKKLITINRFSLKNNKVELNVPLVFAKQLDLKKLADDQKLIGEELELVGFNIIYFNEGENSSVKKNNKEKTLPLISFTEINAHQGKIQLKFKDENTYSINNVRGHLKDFDTETNKHLTFYSKDIEVRASDITGYFNNKNDKLIISGIKYQGSDNSLNLSQLNLIPVQEKLKYAYQFGHEVDWVNLVMKNIHFSDFNLKALLEDNKLLINSITAGSLDAELYRDKKMPQKNKTTSLPQTVLKELKLDINIDTVHIKNTNIVYQELSEQAFEPGELEFSNLDLIVTNITNIPSQITKRDRMILQGSGNIENLKLSVTAVFDLDSDNDEFRLAGQMGEGNMEVFNDIMKKNAFIRIDKGYSKGISFNMLANNDHAIGSMQFHYKNLKISLLDKQTNKSSGLDESLASFFANTFVINSNNPRLFVLKEGNIYFQRDKSKSIFNYWTKSLLSGIVSSIGVKDNKKENEGAFNQK